MRFWNRSRLGYKLLIPFILVFLCLIPLSYSVLSAAEPTPGEVWTWGANSYIQLKSNIPVQVSGLDGVVKIAASDEHVVVLRSDGTVWAWGRNLSGQLGNGTNIDSSVPVQVIGLTDVVDIDASAG
jgi:alpha-tubulin suppressor-like RCC1 family protein